MRDYTKIGIGEFHYKEREAIDAFRLECGRQGMPSYWIERKRVLADFCWCLNSISGNLLAFSNSEREDRFLQRVEGAWEFFAKPEWILYLSFDAGSILNVPTDWARIWSVGISRLLDQEVKRMRLHVRYAK